MNSPTFTSSSSSLSDTEYINSLKNIISGLEYQLKCQNEEIKLLSSKNTQNSNDDIMLIRMLHTKYLNLFEKHESLCSEYNNLYMNYNDLYHKYMDLYRKTTEETANN